MYQSIDAESDRSIYPNGTRVTYTVGKWTVIGTVVGGRFGYASVESDANGNVVSVRDSMLKVIA